MGAIIADVVDPDSTAPAPDVPPALFAALAADPLAAHLGITLEQVSPGYARASMTVGPAQLNAVGTAHGGATMALLDVVHAAVSNSHGTVAVAQDVHTEFLAPGRPGDHLVAEGTELHRSSRTAVYRIEARAQDGRMVATALARVFRTGRDWELTPAAAPPTMQLTPVDADAAPPPPPPVGGPGTRPAGPTPTPDELR